MLRNLHLAMLAGPVIPGPVPRAVIEALQSVEVTVSTDQPGGFQLQFALSNRSALQTLFILAGGALPPLFRVILIVTIGGAAQVLIDGVITHTQISGGVGGRPGTLTLSGTDLTAMMDLVEFSGLPFPAMPVEAQVALIVAKYAVLGLVPAIIPRLFTSVPNPTEDIPVQQGTDLEYINLLAQEAGYVFYIESGSQPGVNIAYWGPEVKIGVPQPALNLDMDASANVESLNFSYDATKAVVPVVYIQNERFKTALPVPIPNLNPLQPPLGAVPTLPQKFRQLHGTANLSPLEALQRGLAEASESADTVSAHGSLDVARYGRLLKARGLVGVRGAGTAYDGLYYVKSVSTSFRRGGECKQNFELTRNGLVSLTPTVPV